MGPANSDERHRLTINMGVDLPWNMQLSGIGVYSSGLPIAVVTGTDDNSDGNLTNDFPNGQGRNSERGDDQKNLNLRLTKLFDMKSLKMQLFVDAFNVFDWTNYTSYIGNMPGFF